MARLTYRPEIDGLRALAVLAVLFFHSHLRLPGGYVGVDIFFVISGYLITALIAADLATGTFSFRDFWERRIRRILPAASVTVVACLLLGFVLLLPTDFEELGRSAVAQALLAANVFFYQETGYFAGPAEAKPLLHFWSLAVEEQFYLLFPFYLVALHRWRPRAMFAGVASVAAASLALSLVGVFRFPDATFFLLPTRAWELALGALLALKGGRLPVPDSLRAPLGWMGMALMIAPMFLYDSETRFPGAAALPPCVGAVLVIWSTAAGSFALKALLSWRPVVFVGLISYSLYLWHWPVKVFSHYWFTGLLSPLPLRVGVVFVSFALAWLSWRCVELPFRSKRTLALPRLAGLAAAASVSILLAGAVVAWQEGVPERFPSRVVQYASAYDDRPEAQEADLSVAAADKGELRLLADAPASAPSILLWGDSHARVVSPAVEAMCRDLRVRGFRASRSETASLLNWSEDAELRRYNDAILRWVEQHRPTVVVLASRWERVLRTRVDEESLNDTVQALQAAGVTVAIMRQVAAQRRDIPKSL
ncbi:MAG TPA: acyltransferase family protein, partial [Opitutus sp.]|nr:acyltransferase family protein [Opitutus sp.]